MFIVDLLRRGDEHGNINMPIINILAKTEIASHAWLSHDSTSISILKKYQDITVEEICILQTRRYKWITSTFLTLKILVNAKIKNEKIFFLSTTPLQNFIITLFSLLNRSGTVHYVVLHGELSYLINPVGIGRRIGRFFLQATFKVLPFANICQITLAYPVYKEIKRRYRLKNELVNFEMPSHLEIGTTEKKLSVDVRSQARNYKLRIGSFGVHSAEKKSDLIYDLANLLQDHSNNFQIVTIGVAHSDFCYDQHPMVKHYCVGTLSNALIPRKLFLEEVRKLDFALFFYGANARYELISSGAFSDCVNLGIPFMALSSNYFSHYLERYGEIGIVKNSLSELASELINISNSSCELSIFKLNLQAVQESRSLKNFEIELLDFFGKN